jgi:hypothetical protein
MREYSSFSESYGIGELSGNATPIIRWRTSGYWDISAVESRNRGSANPARPKTEWMTEPMDNMKAVLTTKEMDSLFEQDAGTEHDGGFQSLLVKLQKQTNRATGEIEFTPDDLKRIPRYAFEYSNGGWQGRLLRAFERVLGPRLGR